MNVDKFRLTPEMQQAMAAAKRARLEAMTPEERRDYEENEEAEAWREALSEEHWGQA